MTLFNQFSYVLGSSAVGVVLLMVLWWWRKLALRWRAGLFAVYVLAATLLSLVFRYPSSTVQSVEEVEAVLANRRPTFVMLYSNY